jgi:ribosomal protein L10
LIKLKSQDLKLAVIENEIYGDNSLNQIAALQSKPELISAILSSLDAPVSGIVGSINAVMRDLASVIEEAAKKKAA